ncbi:MAG: calcium-binding protein [Terricaulis sp.]
MGTWNPGPGPTSGDDIFTGDASNETADGGDGNDILAGGAGSDVLNGGDGADELWDNLYNRGSDDRAGDELYGGGGDDRLWGTSLDIFDGGADFDIADISESPAAPIGRWTLDLSAFDRGEDVVLPGGGRVRGNVERPTFVVVFNPADVIGSSRSDTVLINYYLSQSMVLRGGGGDDIFSVGGAGADELYGDSGDDQLDARPLPGIIYASDASDLLDGGDGNDRLSGNAGDRFIGGAGTDSVEYTPSIAESGFLDLRPLTSGTGTLASSGAVFSSIETINVLGLLSAQLQVQGTDGANSMSGGNLADVLFGNGGVDHLTGNGGDDLLDGGSGADTLFGSAGQDTASYASATERVIVDLVNIGANRGDAAGDFFIEVENIAGSAFDDELRGDSSGNVLAGNGGDDVLNGGAGADVLNGGVGSDTVEYSASGAGVTINLAAGAGLGGDAQGDTLISIERVIGTNQSDTFMGNDSDNVFRGGGGADSLGGGAGTDTADYTSSGAGVNVNLQANVATGGDAAGDTFVSVENLTGSALADTLTGRDFVANTLSGGDGDDVLSGGTGGADVMNGGNGIDTLDYSLSPNGVDVRLFSGAAAGGSANGDTYSSIENIVGSATKTDTLAGDANANQIWGGGGNETITGREASDTLHGEAGNDTLLGGADSDTLIGGIGADTLGGGSQDDLVDYSASNAGVTVNLQTGAGTGGHAQGDVFVSIEDVTGSDFDDVIVGKNNLWDNVFDGRGGNDTYTGGLGNDVFVFRAGSGADTVTDFNPLAVGNDDAIQLAGFGAGFDSFAEVIAAASQVGADTVINFGAGQTLTLQNTTLASLTAGDFIFG